MEYNDHILYGKYHVIPKPHNFTNDFVMRGDQSVILPEDLSQAALGVARELAPYDTGNLADAIYQKRGMNKAKEFSIVYPFNFVNYLHFLEFGTEKISMHEGFIRVNTVNAIVGLIEAYFNRNFDVTNLIASTTFQSIANRKGYGHSREAIGFTRYRHASTRTRLQRRMKSLSIYNKYYYTTFI